MDKARLLVVVLLLIATLSAKGQSIPVDSPIKTDISAADSLYLSGEFAQALAKYQELVKQDPKSAPGIVGVVRANLKLQQVQPAYAAAKAAIESQPQVATLHSVMGDVRFRRAEMGEAEQEYQRAIKLDNTQAQAYAGLARLYRSLSLNGRAYDLVNRAHQLAPQDPEIQLDWLLTLPRKERIAALDRYLGSAHPDDKEDTQQLQHYLSFLKASESQPVHNCRLANSVESAETPLEPMMIDSTRIRGWGLKVTIGDRNARLLLDTGAGGILLGRKQAEKAGVIRISDDQIAGIGDKGPVNGYIGYAKSIRIGQLEFHDCIIRVSDRASITDEDGLIGSDVFRSYLVDLNFPQHKLMISHLPKRPGEDANTSDSLDTEGEEEGMEAPPAAVAGAPPAASSPPVRHRPKDRYIAPEMQGWTRIYRFGHLLLVPTIVNGTPPRMFILDTGAFSNLLSTNAAREVSHVEQDYYTTVKGVSGSVKQVYRTDKATLQFGHFKQDNLDVVTFDLSKTSRDVGIEISGTLSFRMLNLLDIKIDYRDGLVDFTYDYTNIRPRGKF